MAARNAPAAGPSQGGSLTVSSEQFATILGVDQRSIRRYAEAGLLMRTKRDTYELLGSIKKLFTHLREEAAGRQGGDSGVNPIHENALLRRAARQTKELELAVAAKRLVPVAVVEDIMSDHIRGLRNMVLTFPQMCSAEMPHLTKMDLETMKGVARTLLNNNAVRVIEQSGMHPELEEHVEPTRRRAVS